MTSEHPIFVPFRGDHVAAIVTVPEGQPRGVIGLLQGSGGPPRSHRYRLWTRTARRLAAAGIASVRLDYRGIGDSTGEYDLSMEAPPIEEVQTVIEVATGALGVEQVGLVGNCLGARTAVALGARWPNVTSVAAVLPQAAGPLLQDHGRAASVRAYRTTQRTLPGLAPVLRKASRALTSSRPLIFIDDLSDAARTADVLLLFGGSAETRTRLRNGMDAIARSTATQRLEVWDLPTKGAAGFRPIHTQDATIDAVVQWMDETLPLAAGRPSIASGSRG